MAIYILLPSVFSYSLQWSGSDPTFNMYVNRTALSTETDEEVHTCTFLYVAVHSYSVLD